MPELAAAENPALVLAFIKTYPAAAPRLLKGQKAEQPAVFL